MHQRRSQLTTPQNAGANNGGASSNHLGVGGPGGLRGPNQATRSKSRIPSHMNGYYLNEDTSAADSFVHEPIAGQPRFMAVQSQKNKDEQQTPAGSSFGGGTPASNQNAPVSRFISPNMASPDDIKVILKGSGVANQGQNRHRASVLQPQQVDEEDSELFRKVSQKHLSETSFALEMDGTGTAGTKFQNGDDDSSNPRGNRMNQMGPNSGRRQGGSQYGINNTQKGRLNNPASMRHGGSGAVSRMRDNNASMRGRKSVLTPNMRQNLHQYQDQEPSEQYQPDQDYMNQQHQQQWQQDGTEKGDEDDDDDDDEEMKQGDGKGMDDTDYGSEEEDDGHGQLPIDPRSGSMGIHRKGQQPSFGGGPDSGGVKSQRNKQMAGFQKGGDNEGSGKQQYPTKNKYALQKVPSASYGREYDSEEDDGESHSIESSSQETESMADSLRQLFKRKPLLSSRKEQRMRRSQPVLGKYGALSLSSPLFQSQFIELISKWQQLQLSSIGWLWLWAFTYHR
ncbi:hypothetical protein FGO68_gene16421 [Halteria grandinella]|uniref:Uncharacterized protein n=1 Tax=Halteria grandinella TaxID=5974 RepID=A0A8J8T9B7_HALGN|nr:hypothetical protein FGO68_gene16421 [Halteria grandinella]